jgi:serine/threonine protein kinase
MDLALMLSSWSYLLSPFLSCLSRLFSAQRSFVIDGRRYVIVGAPLGQGATCTVHRVESPSGECFAVKEMLRAALVDVRREVAAHLAVQHANVLPLLAWSIESGSGSSGSSGSGSGSSGAQRQELLPGGDEEECTALLLLPLARQGSLLDAIAAALRPAGSHVGAALSEAQALQHCSALARGLCALHASGRSHRDVNPRNLLLPGPGLPQQLGDLGSSGPLLLPIATRLEALRAVEEAATRTSMPYRAPELWQCDPSPQPLQGAAADVWALGCTLYACLYGVSPYECQAAPGGGLRLCEPCHSRTLGLVAFPAWPQVSQGVQQLIAACTELQPARRPSMGEVEERLQQLLLARTRAGAGAP